ncbi:hypothetical protein Tco_0870178 [Tanacetum coccineum]
MTNVKLTKDMHESNFDKLYAYLKQHELSPIAQQFYSSLPQLQSYEAPIPQQPYHASFIHSPPVVPQQGYSAERVGETKSEFYRTRNSEWFKEKMLLVQAQELGVVLDEEQIAFLVDPGVALGLDTQTTLPINAAFQTDDLDAFNSECDEAPSARAVLIANISSYD